MSFRLTKCAGSNDRLYPPAHLVVTRNLKTSLYQKLFDVLTGKDQRPEWSKLSPDTRQAIREILDETQRDLPDYWRTDQSTKPAR